MTDKHVLTGGYVPVVEKAYKAPFIKGSKSQN